MLEHRLHHGKYPANTKHRYKICTTATQRPTLYKCYTNVSWLLDISLCYIDGCRVGIHVYMVYTPSPKYYKMDFCRVHILFVLYVYTELAKGPFYSTLHISVPNDTPRGYGGGLRFSALPSPLQQGYASRSRTSRDSALLHASLFVPSWLQWNE